MESKKFFKLNYSALEFMLLLGVIGFLYWLSLDLTTAKVALGRGLRYANSNPDSLQMQRIASRAGELIALLGLTGWIVLSVGRQAHAHLVAVCLGLATWSLTAYFFYGNTQWIWLEISAVCLIFAIILTLILRPERDIYRQSATHPAIYPGFVLLSGLGWLLLIDLSSQAMAKNLTDPTQWLALKRADQMLWIFCLVTVTASVAHVMLNEIVRILSKLDSSSPVTNSHPILFRPVKFVLSRAGHMIFFAVWIGAIIAYFIYRKGQDKHLAIQGLTSELLRAPSYFMLAWIMYRWESRDWSRRVFGIGLVGSVLGAGFLFTDDSGQIFVLGVAACVFVASALAGYLQSKTACTSWWLITGAALLGGGLVLAGFTLLAHSEPFFAKYPALHNIALRIHAINTLWSGKFQYLSELRWYMADSHFFGYGLGNTPYCGTLSSLLPANICRGLPKEAPYDYIFGVLSGIFGPAGAWSVCAITAWWLVTLSSQRPLPDKHPQKHAQQYGSWIAVCFAGFSLAQLFVTSLASIGAVALTGVTFPLISYGGTAFMNTAIIVSLVINRIDISQRSIPS